MTQNSERKIKELIIDIFTPENTSNETIDFLKKASKECPVTRNLSQEIDIKISWHNDKSQHSNYKKYNEILYWNSPSFIWNIHNDRLGIKD